jgi:hypothetical protein
MRPRLHEAERTALPVRRYGVNVTVPARPIGAYISVRDMTEEGTVDTNMVQYISKANHETIKRYTISRNDVYVSIAGTIGKTGLIHRHSLRGRLSKNAGIP